MLSEVSNTVKKIEAKTDEKQAAPELFIDKMGLSEQIEETDELNDLLNFKAEEDPEVFFNQSVNETVSGTFVILTGISSMISTYVDTDWDVDLSPAQITGDGISYEATIVANQDSGHDFLKVRSRGRQSIRCAIVQSGTRLSIDSEICLNWVIDILKKSYFTVYDMEALISLCEGNGDPEELRFNLQQTLEAAGLELFDDTDKSSFATWDVRSDVSYDELTEAIEAVFTRAARLPGTRRFTIDKSDETRLLEPMVRTKLEFHLGILACTPAVKIILDAVSTLRRSFADNRYVTLKTIIPARADHAETVDFFRAADILDLWNTDGRIMDGKRRREALNALEALDLSMIFYKEMVKKLAGIDNCIEDAAQLDGLISIFEAANERLILEHLSYARRFAARNVENGEDSEDVFQVAFIGLQRAARRFDPERGNRFIVYCTFWMRQALTRWRADESAVIRIPVHQYQKLANLDHAIGKLDLRQDSTVSDDELAGELSWTHEEVEQLRQIPRQCRYIESIEEWDEVFPESQIDDVYDRTETKRIVADVLAGMQGRQADVIRMRFGIGSGHEMTLEEIGQIYGVTRERIRQIEAKGMCYLLHPARKRHLQTLLGI